MDKQNKICPLLFILNLKSRYLKILVIGNIESALTALNVLKNYCCPIKLLKRDKFRTDSFAGVSPFWLFSCRQTKPNNQCAKIVILADSRSMVR